MKNCLVIGGSGFLGKNLSLNLCKLGHKVTVIDKKKIYLNNVKFVKNNIRNLNSIRAHLKNNDYVFHLAGISSLNEALSRPIETVQQNILITVKILKLCIEYKVKRFIYASSIYTVSEQGGFYRASKLASENYIQEFQKRFGLNYTILRYGSLYGSGANEENTINKILANYKKTKKLVYSGNFKNIRSYINVNDASKATIRTLDEKYKNKIVLIKGPQKTKVLDLMKVIKDKLKTNTKIIFKNRKDVGHYIKLPKKIIIKQGINLKLKNYISLEKGIQQIIKTKN